MNRDRLFYVLFVIGLGAMPLTGPVRAQLVPTQGLATYPHTLDELQQGLEQLYRAPPADGETAAETAALRRLNAYRFLAGVPADVRLDPSYSESARAGARLLEKIGRLDHMPDNPGLPDDEYQAGLKGTSHSNIFWSTEPSLRAAVDSFMEDSDEHNIARVGHRRWCLNPAMQATGFGQSGVYICMWAFDDSRRDVPDWKLITYPARGLMPVDHFSADRAWNVTANPRHVPLPTATFDVQVFPLNADMAKGRPLEIEFKNFDTSYIGVPNVMVFRPKSLAVIPGAKYWAEITCPAEAGKEPLEIKYLVEFVDLKRGAK